METDSSAPVRPEAPHATSTTNTNRTTRTRTIVNALTRRAHAVLNDESIDAQSRAIIRYALEINDPWLARLVQRADAGEALVDTEGFLQTDVNDPVDVSEERIEALAEMICRGGDEPATKSAALFLLMAALENSAHPKALANTAKHFAFVCCGELNFAGMVDAQLVVIEGKLFGSA